MAKRIDQSYLRKASFAYLQRYASSSSNLRRVLFRKVRKRAEESGQDPEQFREDIEAAIKWCLDNKLLDDRQYAETRLNGLQRKGSSERKIRASLKEKGVPDDLIEDVMRNAEYDEFKAARRYAQRKRLGGFRMTSRDDRDRRDLAAMARAGFGYAASMAALRQPDNEDNQ